MRSSLGEYLEKSREVTDLTDNGKCRKCGSCCSNALMLTDNEVRVIKRYVFMHGIREQKQGSAVLKDPAINMNCPFLDEDNSEGKKCTIYAVRPEICRDFNCYDYCTGNIHVSDNLLNEAHVVDMRATFFPKSSWVGGAG